MVIHIQIKNRQRGNIQKKNTYQLGMQHREYLEVAKLAEVPHRLDFDTLGDKRANFRKTNEQTSEAAAEETNEQTSGRKINSTYNEQGKQKSLRIQSSEIEPGTEGNTRTTTRGNRESKVE